MYSTLDHKENRRLVDALDDLIHINNDRMTGYQKSLENLTPDDDLLASLFVERIEESSLFCKQISAEITRLGGLPEETTPGALYGLWTNLRSTFTLKDNRSMLELCEFREEAVLEVYDRAIESNISWSSEAMRILTKQRDLLQDAHDLIRDQRTIVGD